MVDGDLVKPDCGLVVPSLVPLVACGLVVPLVAPFVVLFCFGCVRF